MNLHFQDTQVIQLTQDTQQTHNQMTTIVFGVSGRTKALVISHGQILLGVLGVIKPFELTYMLWKEFLMSSWFYLP